MSQSNQSQYDAMSFSRFTAVTLTISVAETTETGTAGDRGVAYGWTFCVSSSSSEDSDSTRISAICDSHFITTDEIADIMRFFITNNNAAMSDSGCGPLCLLLLLSTILSHTHTSKYIQLQATSTTEKNHDRATNEKCSGTGQEAAFDPQPEIRSR